MFYSKATGGFYTREIHGKNIPADAVEITAEEHIALLSGQSAGKVIGGDEAGRPALFDAPEPTAEEVQTQVNRDARRYLAETDWYVIRLQETGEPIPADVLSARQEARDSVVLV